MAEHRHNCEETLREIEMYLDGELTQEISVSVSHHLSGCHPCTSHAEFRRHLKIIVSRKCCEHEVPAELTEKIRSLIRSNDASTDV
jgi:mycothiol system anti-sigma-R factor